MKWYNLRDETGMEVRTDNYMEAEFLEEYEDYELMSIVDLTELKDCKDVG